VKAGELSVFVENHHIVLRRTMVGVEVEWIRVECRQEKEKRDKTNRGDKRGEEGKWSC
jgi:hypothetical protein